MDSHKRVLGILYVISGALTILILAGVSLFFNAIFGFAMQEVDADERWVLELIQTIMQFLPIILIILFGVPSIIAGIGLLNQQKWALLLALILGCFKLFNFPIGTALGVYTIWVYAEDQKQAKAAT